MKRTRRTHQPSADAKRCWVAGQPLVALFRFVGSAAAVAADSWAGQVVGRQLAAGADETVQSVGRPGPERRRLGRTVYILDSVVIIIHGSIYLLKFHSVFCCFLHSVV